MATISWLHISDLHFRESQTYDATIVLQALLRDLNNRVEIAPELKDIDFIFVTGDIAFAGKTNEYGLACRFLDKLRRTTHVRKDHLLIVPGNHDADRSLLSTETHNILGRLGDRQAVNALLGNEVNRAKIIGRFQQYQSFFNDYLGRYLTFDSVRYFYVKRFRIDNNRVAILGLNSAWASASDADQLNLFLGEQQVRAPLDQTEDTDIRIVLIHHPFEWLQDFDRYSCEPLLLNKCDFVLHGHLHRTGITRLQSPGSDAMIIGAGACYETLEYPNSYNLVCLDLDSGAGTVYLRAYSKAQGGFWTQDCTTYHNVQGKYSFQKPLGKKKEEGAIKRRQAAALAKWWENRGYKSDPFVLHNAADVIDEDWPDLFQHWYVDPNMPAKRRGLGESITLDAVKSLEMSGPVLIYVPGGGGKTFYRRWAARQIEEYERSKCTIELYNLAGRVDNPERISARDLALCVYESICDRFPSLALPAPAARVSHILAQVDEALKRLSSPKEALERVFVFVDDLDRLLNEHNGKQNLNTLWAIAELCAEAADRNGGSLALRLFLPLELKRPIQKLMGSGRRQRILEVIIRWGLDHCEAILEARLDSYWEDGPNKLIGGHLDRLLRKDARTELQRWLQGKSLSPRCIIRLFRELGYYAYEHNIATELISRDHLVDFLKGDRAQMLCAAVKYPLARFRSPRSIP